MIPEMTLPKIILVLVLLVYGLYDIFKRSAAQPARRNASALLYALAMLLFAVGIILLPASAFGNVMKLILMSICFSAALWVALMAYRPLLSKKWYAANVKVCSAAWLLITLASILSTFLAVVPLIITLIIMVGLFFYLLYRLFYFDEQYKTFQLR